MAKTHILKTLATVWDAVAAGKKPWEIRRNDRFFQVGDIVVLRKIHDEGDMSPGAYVQNHDSKSGFYDLEFRIGWMLQITGGYCIFSLDPIEPAKTLYWADWDGDWIFTEDRSELVDDLPLGRISRTIHSSAEPHLQWAVRAPIETDDEGHVTDDELRWFDSHRDAEDCVDSLNEPEVIEPAPPAPCGGLTGSEIPTPQTPPSPDEEVIF